MLYKIYSKIKKLIQQVNNLKSKYKRVYTMSEQQERNNGAIIIGALILGLLLLKSIADRQTQVYRCPICSLVIRKNTEACPRCYTVLSWQGVP